MKLTIKDTYNKELPEDPILENTPRQVSGACYSYVTPKKTTNPELIHVSPDMLAEIGLTLEDSKTAIFTETFTGNSLLPNTKPYAMCYGGHQFGNWAGQLGDGRAINLAEVEYQSKHWALQLKGAGPTPYSRTADGLAVLRSSIREYLCSEAMHHLGVPTTRALSLSLTGDNVLRDILYNGNPAYEKGAVVCRVAPSFIRFGNFQIFAARQDIKNLKKLTDYTIRHFFSHLGAPSKAVYLQFFKEVMLRNLDMVIHWQRVGFVHGVMNTDNMSILGLTIDYGPYGWLEGYDAGWTPNTTDRQYKRYRFGNQADIVLWNLYQLANALYPLIEESQGLEAILEEYTDVYAQKYAAMMRSKLGLQTSNEKDIVLIHNLEENLQESETDMTIFFRNLSNFNSDKYNEGLQIVWDAFYNTDEITETIKQKWNSWFKNFAERVKQEKVAPKERKEKMNLVNPKYVLRNYMAQLAIEAAEKGDYLLIDALFKLLKNPYKEQIENKKWFAKRPDWARDKVGCSMLSCSS
ncbi:protein adenylyltransferase SelO [uncultured Maribacter sp.]|uniref:protein adenylyltransferase SelO n=1 Tax=uncultured Maribacter sp. TaxID=431308 RepID=UPI00260F8BD5|nr:YdiU family protein [uncultured Maribacter sp.]